MKILVTGATGGLGSSVIDSLLNKTIHSDISALVRDTESEKAKALKAKGVEVRPGDYSDYDSLLKAFEGIEKMYFVSGSDVVARTKQHENVVNAAKEAGVKHVVYTSFQRRNETSSSPIALVAEAHIKTENWLKESGITYTILKHNIYADMIPMFVGEKVLETGAVYLPTGDGKTGFVTREDMAEAGAVILTTSGHENKEYDITSNTTVSYADIAAMLSEIAGKTIAFVSPSIEEYTKTLADVGVPAEYIGVFAGFSEATKQGEFDKTGDTLEMLLRRKPVSVKEFLQQVYSSEKVA